MAEGSVPTLDRLSGVRPIVRQRENDVSPRDTHQFSKVRVQVVQVLQHVGTDDAIK